jgi:hypothetical protein
MAARDMVAYGSLIHRQFREDITQKHPDTFAARYA